ncbi:MAG: DUF1146 family protein [Candidatus Cohnella colombiensis]|uniref:DUF1146 family protein n=1 Tax=Candidatus Cohnella colombiensis TaxID=3121368 RepID=A0AA95EVZ6_9BACL|nr:MAG: DUF1146 family protein [Cohnella sp.]
MDQASWYASEGMNGIFSILVTLACVAIAWITLHELNFDKIVRHPASPKARLLQLLIAIALGYALASFLLDYWTWAGAVKWLFNSG